MEPTGPGKYGAPVPWTDEEYRCDVSTDEAAHPARVPPPVPSTSSTLRAAYALKRQLCAAQADSIESYGAEAADDVSPELVERVEYAQITGSSDRRRTDSSCGDNHSWCIPYPTADPSKLSSVPDTPTEQVS